MFLLKKLFIVFRNPKIRRLLYQIMINLFRGGKRLSAVKSAKKKNKKITINQTSLRFLLKDAKATAHPIARSQSLLQAYKGRVKLSVRVLKVSLVAINSAQL